MLVPFFLLLVVLGVAPVFAHEEGAMGSMMKLQEVPKANLQVQDQSLRLGSVAVKTVESPVASWLIIHEDQAGKPGAVIGKTLLPAGKHTEVRVTLEKTQGVNRAWAMLHGDTGKVGVFEKGIDLDLAVKGKVVEAPFRILPQ